MKLSSAKWRPFRPGGDEWKPNCGLRSDDKLVLNVPATKLETKIYGDLYFSIARTNLRNQLPNHIRLSKSIYVLKSSLKTYIFKDAFHL